VTLAAGSTFGPYQILGALGRGGMATVYKAYEPALDRYVALKVLPREFIHDPGFATRFEREAKVIAKLEHPNIIPIHNFGIEPESNTPWMAMRFISGGTLSAIVRSGRLVPSRAIGILRGVADALDYAHGKGVIHRDVKPQNILLDDAERVYLADFGIAKMVEGSQGLTVTGMVTGTPQYMAPEQGMGRKVDHRADIYALGVVAYEMLTGSVPFSADTPVAVMMKHVTGPIPVPSPEDVPEVFTRALLKALAKEPEERWPSAGAFLHALEMGQSEAPTAVGISALATPTIVSQVPEGAPTAISAAQEAAATAVSSAPAVPPTIVSPAPPVPPTIVSPAPGATASSAAPARVEPTLVSPPPPPPPATVPPRPSPPAAPGRSVSGLSLMLGLLALILLLGVIGAAFLLWPRSPRGEQTTQDSLVAESSPLGSPTPTLPSPMASGASPDAGALRNSRSPGVASTLPAASSGPSASVSPLPTGTATPVAPATPPPYRDAGKITKGKDFYEKILTFVRNGSVPLGAEVGPLRIATVKFVTLEEDERVNVHMLFPIECPKDAGEWNTRIDVEWLAADGDKVENDTDRDSCRGEEVTSELRARNVPSEKAATIRGVRIRFEATPD
jgi:hypothetical protein